MTPEILVLMSVSKVLKRNIVISEGVKRAGHRVYWSRVLSSACDEASL